MSEVYRGHEIELRDGPPLSAIIIERRSGATLPTKITALPNEGEYACLRRARELVDLYLQPPRLGRGTWANRETLMMASTVVGYGPERKPAFASPLIALAIASP